MDVLEGLNPEQRRAAEAVRGPVCILAGAGSGKTTTITRRIAQQVASGAFAADQIMAVTFTEKAAGQLKSRLQALGVQRVRASTFHSAALRQLRHFAPGDVGQVLPSKALALRQLANALPAPFKFRPAGDLATEIEWAKNRRIPAEAYRGAARDREPAVSERSDVPYLPRLRGAQGRRGNDRLRGPARADCRSVRARRGRTRCVPRAVSRVHGRRIPGRQPASAVVARPLARRPRRLLRRRRRLSVDLRVPRREPVAPARRPAALPERARRSSRGELPLDAAGSRARKPARTGSRAR